MRPFALMAAVLAACGTPRGGGPSADERDAITIDAAHALVKSGQIGFTDKTPGTYALVDVSNRSAKDRLVTLEAQLVDGAGKPVARLSSTPMRIPAAETRTFALVAERTVPEAHGVAAALSAATPLDYPAQVAVDSPGFSHVQEYAVATGTAKNVIDKDETATLVASFYDADGHLLSRPAVIVDLPVGATRALRFEGPKEAVRATVYPAEIVFPQ